MSRGIKLVGIFLIVVVGLIHLVEGPEYLEEVTYVGVLFFLNAFGSFVSAYGIWRGRFGLGWGLGLLMAAGAFIAYVLSRTTGLPAFTDDIGAWFEPLGIVSLVVEAAFVFLFFRARS